MTEKCYFGRERLQDKNDGISIAKSIVYPLSIVLLSFRIVCNVSLIYPSVMIASHFSLQICWFGNLEPKFSRHLAMSHFFASGYSFMDFAPLHSFVKKSGSNSRLSIYPIFLPYELLFETSCRTYQPHLPAYKADKIKITLPRWPLLKLLIRPHCVILFPFFCFDMITLKVQSFCSKVIIYWPDDQKHVGVQFLIFMIFTFQCFTSRCVIFSSPDIWVKSGLIKHTNSRWLINACLAESFTFFL